jgi:antitoxin StbD
LDGHFRDLVAYTPRDTGARRRCECDDQGASLHETCYEIYYLVSRIAPETNSMTHQLLAETAASISELKANPMKVVASGNGMPVVVLNRNEPAFYCVPANAYEAMMEMVDDLELLKLVKKRQQERSVKVSFDDL